MSQPRSRIALATCAALPEGDADDAPLRDALDASWVVWNDGAVDWDAFALVVVRSTWDYTERREDFLAWARRLGARLVNPPEILVFNTDKAYLLELAAAGLPVVATTLLAPGAASMPPPPGDYVVKPTVSAGSRDTARFGPGDGERAAALVAAIHASGRTAMLQPYLGSVDARGETALLFFDGVFSHAIRKGPLLAPGEGPTPGLFAPEAIVPRTAAPDEIAMAERVVAWVSRRFGGAPAYARVDLLRDGTGAPVLLELELTEPSLFFTQAAPGAVERFAAAVLGRHPAGGTPV